MQLCPEGLRPATRAFVFNPALYGGFKEKGNNSHIKSKLCLPKRAQRAYKQRIKLVKVSSLSRQEDVQVLFADCLPFSQASTAAVFGFPGHSTTYTSYNAIYTWYLLLKTNLLSNSGEVERYCRESKKEQDIDSLQAAAIDNSLLNFFTALPSPHPQRDHYIAMLAKPRDVRHHLWILLGREMYHSARTKQGESGFCLSRAFADLFSRLTRQELNCHPGATADCALPIHYELKGRAHKHGLERQPVRPGPRL